MAVIRRFLVLAVLCDSAWAASPYNDGATSQFFKSLFSPYTHNCCDQADCRVAASDYRIDADGNGYWWAKSNRTGTWVRIEPKQITSDDSVFSQAILCEGAAWQRGEDGEYVPSVFCFARPPSGF